MDRDISQASLNATALWMDGTFSQAVWTWLAADLPKSTVSSQASSGHPLLEASAFGVLNRRFPTAFQKLRCPVLAKVLFAGMCQKLRDPVLSWITSSRICQRLKLLILSPWLLPRTCQKVQVISPTKLTQLLPFFPLFPPVSMPNMDPPKDFTRRFTIRWSYQTLLSII